MTVAYSVGLSIVCCRGLLLRRLGGCGVGFRRLLAEVGSDAGLGSQDAGCTMGFVGSSGDGLTAAGTDVGGCEMVRRYMGYGGVSYRHEAWVAMSLGGFVRQTMVQLVALGYCDESPWHMPPRYGRRRGHVRRSA